MENILVCWNNSSQYSNPGGRNSIVSNVILACPFRRFDSKKSLVPKYPKIILSIEFEYARKSCITIMNQVKLC